METKRKDLYETPSTIVFEVKFEGLICQSTKIDPMSAPEDI